MSKKPATTLAPTRREFLAAALGSALAWPALGAEQTDAAAGGIPFLAVGDWGWDGGRAQQRVAGQMARTAADTACRFVVSVGDNFYSDGVASVDDPHWQRSYEAVYSAPALQVPWYPILGNHDYRGDPEAQVAYSAKSARWRMPARYYERSESSPETGQVDFFHIDTSPFVEAYRDSKVRIDGQDTKTQLAWLDGALGKSTARWKIVVGHHPVFSGGQHGSQKELMAALKPLLDRHGVSVYLFGHDHDLQHIVVDDLHYIGCGAGGDTRRTSKIVGSLFAADDPGFFSGRIGGDHFDFAFFGADGDTLYRAMLPRRTA